MNIPCIIASKLKYFSNLFFIRSSLKYLLYVSIIFFTLTYSIYGAEYYIDYSSGADTNNGTSSTSPFQHCPGDSNATGVAASTTFSAGDIIYFKKGVTYYVGTITCGQSGALQDSGSNATVTSNGVFISAGQNFQSTVQTGDYVYIYNYEDDGIGYLTAGGKYLGSCGLWTVETVDSNTQLTLLNYDGDAYSTPTMYYRVMRPISYTSKSDWGTGNAVIDGNSTQKVFFNYNNKNYLRFANLRFQNTYDCEAGSCTYSSTTAALYNTRGRVKIGMIIEDCAFVNCWSAERVSYSDYNVARNNTVTNFGSWGLCSGRWSLIENNSLDNGMVAIGGTFDKQSIARYNIITNMSKDAATYCGGHADGFFPICPRNTGNTNEYGWIYNNLITNTVSPISLTYTRGGTIGYTIHSNVIIGYHGLAAGSAPYNRSGNGSRLIQVYSAPYTKIYNNILFGMPGCIGMAEGIVVSNGGQGAGYESTHVVMENNIIVNYISSFFTAIKLRTNASDLSDFDTCEYNFYYFPNRADNMFMVETSIPSGGRNFTEWKALGYDNVGHSTGTTTDPKFVDTTVSDLSLADSWKQIDLSLQSDSPCINAGLVLPEVTVGINKILRPQGTTHDISAYEFELKPEPPSNLRIISQ